MAPRPTQSWRAAHAPAAQVGMGLAEPLAKVFAQWERRDSQSFLYLVDGVPCQPSVTVQQLLVRARQLRPFA
jgi:hypothetical protein